LVLYPKYTKYFYHYHQKNSINYKQSTSASIHAQVTPRSELSVYFLGLRFSCTGYPVFLVSCTWLPFLCCFGFGGWAGGLWRGSCNPLAVGWLGLVLCLCVLCLGVGVMY